LSQKKLVNYLNKYQNEINIVGPLIKESITIKDPVIYIDGGTQFKTNQTGISIGDGDSFEGELDIKLSKEKNYSDLAYALGNIPSQYHKINLHGFLGERRDHELINLAEVHSFLLNRTVPTKVSFDDSVIAYSTGSWELTIEDLFTLFSFEKNKINLSGKCKYPLNDHLKALSSHGLSNIGSGKVSLKNESPIFLFF